MKIEDFSPQAPGEVRRGREGFLTFIPARLPPELAFSGRLCRQIADAERAIGELASLCRQLKNPFLFLRPFVAREAVLSSRIEGTATRLDQLLLFELDASSSANTGDAWEVLNYVRALEEGIEGLAQMPLCLRLLRQVHAKLMEGVRGQEKRPGRFRDCAVAIARDGQDFHQARFVPPPHDLLDPLLKDFEQFLNAEHDLPLVARLALAHYQFEAIHPFMDGNGRIGRLLITLMLHASGALPRPILYLSAYFEAHGSAYRDHLLAISQRGTWTEWVAFFAEGIREQAVDAAERARRLLDLHEQYRLVMQKASQSSVVLQLVDHLFHSPFITIPGAAALMNLTHTAATKNVNRLIEQEILVETHPGRKTRRVFHAPRILKLLDAKLKPQTHAPHHP